MRCPILKLPKAKLIGTGCEHTLMCHLPDSVYISHLAPNVAPIGKWCCGDGRGDLEIGCTYLSSSVGMDMGGDTPRREFFLSHFPNPRRP
jgi:hypothetical protein